MYEGMKTYRALVTYSSAATGDVLVKIPSILGSESILPISFIGRSKAGSVWKVPEIGQQVLVAVEDDRFSNVYIVTPGYIENYSSEFSQTNEPTGFANKNLSKISFDNASKTFTIEPLTTSFDVWCKGVKYTKRVAESIAITDTSDVHYIYYFEGVLSTKTTFFDLENEAPVAYIYWNYVDQVAYFFADERHGIVMDWATHEYLHRTRGAALATGLGLTNYTTTGTGSASTDAQIGFTNGTFYDEDLQIDVTHAAVPEFYTWQQRLQTTAYLPVFYRNGSAALWKKDTATAYPLKFGTRGQYNLNSAGTWSTVDATSNRFIIYWIVATNNLSDSAGNSGPVLSIMGQEEYSNIGQAEAVSWGDMVLTGLPIFEFKLLYKLIFQTNTGYANAVKTKLVSAVDLRASATLASGIPASAVIDHGTLTGLADDDHTQYSLVTGTRAFTGTVYAPSLSVTSASVSGNASASVFVGSGASLTALSATNVTTGTLDAARLPAAASTVTSVGTLTGLTVSGTTNLQSTVQKNGVGAKLVVFAGQAVASASTGVSTTSDTALTGASVSLSLVSGDIVMVTGTFDITCSTAAAGSPLFGSLYVGGSAQTTVAVVQPPTGVTSRFPVTQTWVYTAASTGSVTFDLRAKVNATGSTFTVWNQGSSLTYLVLR